MQGNFNHQGMLPLNGLRANVSKHQTNSKIYGNTLKIDFAHTFMFCRVLYPNYRGIVYLSKYDFVFEKIFILVGVGKYTN